MVIYILMHKSWFKDETRAGEKTDLLSFWLFTASTSCFAKTESIIILIF